jgi:ligand-binding SRPBCC domain-containing protein
MATINKEILIGTPQEKIFNFVNKPNNLLRIWPSLIEVKDEELLPNGGYSFTWVNKMLGIQLKGTGEYTDISPNNWFSLKTLGAIETTITWKFQPKENKTLVTFTVDYRIPAPLFGRLAEIAIMKSNEKEAEVILDNLRTIMEET